MLTYKKDDFDENLEDIMKSVNEIITKNQKNDEEENTEKEEQKLEKK